MKTASAAFALAILAIGTIDAAALDRRVRINNYTSYDIVEFYASNKGSRSWEEDVLGRNILPAGNSVVITSTTAAATANTTSRQFSRTARNWSNMTTMSAN